MGEPAVEPLMAILDDEDWRVRGTAAWALGNLNDERAIPALEKLLDDESGFVKSGAESAIKSISKNLKNEDSETFLVILDDDKNIIGILIYYISKFPVHFNFKSFRLLLVDILDYFVLCDVNPGDLYIAEIAIDSSLRGQGLGKKVLTQVIDYAKSNNLNRVILDADFRNTGAKSLYDSMGFKVFNKKRVKIGNFERGMYNMELRL